MRKLNIAILDVQPIDPPVGGGRLRLLGLYHGLGDNLQATYVGTFDLPDPTSRQLRLSDCLEEFDEPLSDLHFTVLERWRDRIGRRDLIDVCFGFMGRLSPAYIRRAATVIQEADVVVFSHPWVYPLVRDKLTRRHVVVYDAHNFEGLLRAEMFDDGGAGTELVRHVLAVESALCRRADVVLACSPNDAALFRQYYGVRPERIWEAPNGVFIDQIRPPSEEEKRSARGMLGLDGPAAIFIGSAFPPNIQAVEFIARRLAPALPEITFLICGAVSEAQEFFSYRTDGPRNLRFIGPVTEEAKLRCLWSADAAVNPMFTGSGTNIKMFDFMAAGLPVVSTSTGARGIDGGLADGIFICEAANMAETLRRLVQGDPGHLGGAARKLAIEKYSWKSISAQLGERLSRLCDGRGRPTRLAPIKRAFKALSSRSDQTVSVTREHRPHSRLGFLSPWSVPGYIAEHSRCLAEELEANGWKCFILDGARPGFPASWVRTHNVPVSIESLQRIQATGGAGVGAGCRRAGIATLLVRHHPDFFNEDTLVGIVADCELAGVHVLVDCSNADALSIASQVRCVEHGARIVVHEKAEVRRLESSGVRHVAYVPRGVLQMRSNAMALAGRRFGWKEPAQVIGAFGLPRQGLLELIEAFSMVHEIYAESSLIAIIRDPSEDSQSNLNQCLSFLAHKGLDRHVQIKFDPGSCQSRDLLEHLQTCGLLVLPHLGTDDSAIELVNAAMALRRPVITTRAFNGIETYACYAGAAEPRALAVSICNVLANPEVYRDLESAARAYANERSWNRVARVYEDLIWGTSSPRTFAASGVS